MRKYAASFIRSVVTGDFTGFVLTAAATVRPEIAYLVIGSGATPAAAAHQWCLRRCTTTGTGTAHVGQALDPADVAAIATAANTHTAEPTYTAASYLLNLPLNQQGTLQWMAAKEGAGFIVPATASNGIGIEGNDAAFTPTVPAAAWSGTVHWWE